MSGDWEFEGWGQALTLHNPPIPLPFELDVWAGGCTPWASSSVCPMAG